MSETTDWMPSFGEAAPVDREFRRAVFLAVLPTMVDWDWSSSEKMMQKAWKLADEAIAQEGA